MNHFFNSRSPGFSASRRNSTSFLANLVAVTSDGGNMHHGTASEKQDQDGNNGASSVTAAAAAAGGGGDGVPLYTNQLISFYTVPNSGRDAEDRTLSEILRFPDRDLEYHHDYIQWLFPLPERSPFNPDAPHIDRATAEAFRTRPELRSRLRESFSRMLSFYGFEVVVPSRGGGGGGGAFGIQECSDIDFDRKSRFWLRQFDHNHLRITRIIRSLRVLGLEEEASEFYKVLSRVGTPGPQNRGVSPRTLVFWKRAAKRPLQVPPDDDIYRDVEEEEEEEEKEEDGNNDDVRETESKLEPEGVKINGTKGRVLLNECRAT